MLLLLLLFLEDFYPDSPWVGRKPESRKFHRTNHEGSTLDETYTFAALIVRVRNRTEEEPLDERLKKMDTYFANHPETAPAAPQYPDEATHPSLLLPIDNYPIAVPVSTSSTRATSLLEDSRDPKRQKVIHVID